MAVVSGIILNRLKVPTIIGYILTGVLTTYFFNFSIEDSHSLNDMAELGIVFLMFMIGLDFSFKVLSSMKQEVLLFGGLQIGLAIAFFFAVCYFFLGFNFPTSIVVASAVSLSSTAIVLKYLNETNQTKTQYGGASVGILIFQDIAVIPILLMITLLSDKNSSLSTLLLTTIISAAIVLIILLLPGKFFAKIILRFSASMKTDEIFVGTVFLIVLGAAYLSSKFGFSMSLGAFLAGMIISGTPYKYQVASVLAHFRDILLGVFFITVGMQVNLFFLFKYFAIIIVLVILMMLAKTLLIHIFLAFFRGRRISMRTALSLSQIGEFSFAIFLLASQHHILHLDLSGGVLKAVFGSFGSEFFANIKEGEIYQFLTLMVIFSMIATPFILDKLDKCTNIALSIGNKIAKKRHNNIEDIIKEHDDVSIQQELNRYVIICGYGELGREIATYFKGCDVQYVAIDSQYDKVEQGIKDENHVIFGNCKYKNIFRRLYLDKCASVIITFDDPTTVRSVCDSILFIEPLCKIIVKTRDEKLDSDMKNIGLYGVINEQREIAHTLANLAIQSIQEMPKQDKNNKEIASKD